MKIVKIDEADSVETNCLLAGIKRFILYNVSTENCQSVHAVYLVAS